MLSPGKAEMEISMQTTITIKNTSKNWTTLGRLFDALCETDYEVSLGGIPEVDLGMGLQIVLPGGDKLNIVLPWKTSKEAK